MSNFGKSVLKMADENVLYVASSTSELFLDKKISLWPLNQDPYHYGRLLKSGQSPETCMQIEYNFASTLIK